MSSGPEGPPQRGPDAEQIEERRIDTDAFQSFRVAGPRQVGRPVDEGRQAVEDGVLITIVGEVEGGERRTVALGPRIPHPDEPLGVPHRQRTDDHRLDDGVHCRRGADAEGDRHDDRGRDSGVIAPVRDAGHMGAS
jgi:hypothetical protein